MRYLLAGIQGLAWAGLCLLVAGVSQAAERRITESAAVSLLVSGVPQEQTFRTVAECEAEKARRRTTAAGLEAGQRRYTCRDDRATTVQYGPNPVTPPPPPPQVCAPLPPNRPQDCPTGYAGTWIQRASAAPYPGCVTWSTWYPSTEGCAVVNQPPPPRYMFIDRFEYDVSRSGRSADGLFAGSGWAAVKAINGSMGRGSGYAFTQPDATRGSKVLVLESHPEPITDFPVPQTDYYLQRGREGSTEEVLPANVWIQFWTYATPDSRFSTRDKTIYPCNSHYACSWGPNLGWLFMWGSGGFNVAGDGSSRRYLALEAQNADRDTRGERDGEEAKLFQNVNATPMRGGVWYQVRLHMDTSGEQGTFEAWIKERGQASFTKVSDWRGGQTANFSWAIPTNQRRGHTMFRMPTTVNSYSNTVFIDDFVIAASAEALPN